MIGRANETLASALRALALCLLAALLPSISLAQSLGQDIAPTTLSADLSGGAALFVNPAMMAADPVPRWDLVAAWERDVLRQGLLTITGQRIHLGYRYDSGPTPPISELRLGGAYGSARGGVGYAFRYQHESVWGPNAATGLDLGVFLKPTPGATLSWVARNIGGQRQLEHRHQLIGLALRSPGSKLTLAADLRWDDGGLRTNLVRYGARLAATEAVEVAGTWQPSRLSTPAEVRIGITVRRPSLGAQAAHRLKRDGRGSGTWVGFSGTAPTAPPSRRRDGR